MDPIATFVSGENLDGLLEKLQSFGEPLPLEVNRFGDIYVADIGNNRLQLYNPDGRSIRQWGNAKPDVTNAWYARNRAYYTSGSKPGRKAGQFTNPVDVTLMPEKEVDGFATLDANGRVQLFDSEGRTLISWTASPSYDPEGGLGGTAYIALFAQTRLHLHHPAR